MTETGADPQMVNTSEDEVSLFALGSVLIRRRRMITSLGLLGVFVGLASGLLSTRMYMSAATFIPQGAKVPASGLAAAASQFGINLPSAGRDAWGPPIYVELLKSQVLLEPIALDTVVVTEEGGRRVALLDLLKIKAPTPAKRTDLGVRALRRIVNASEDRMLGAVKLSVTTKWPSVSVALAQRLLRGVDQFNVEARKSQASAERRFVENRAEDAERALRESEDQLQLFLQRNRSLAGSPDLEFQRDRLQREVALRQQVYTTLVQNREEARMLEVRDTPVITVLEGPRLPVVGEARKSLAKGFVGGIAGGILGVLIAFLMQGLANARRRPSEEAQEFFQLMEDATPRFVRRGTSMLK